jgi:hypothetical protein
MPKVKCSRRSSELGTAMLRHTHLVLLAECFILAPLSRCLGQYFPATRVSLQRSTLPYVTVIFLCMQTSQLNSVV